MATSMNSGSPDRAAEQQRSNALFRRVTATGFFLFLVVAAVLPSGLSATFRLLHIPAGSMEPALPVGSYIVTALPAYGYSRYSLDWVTLPVEGRWPAGALPARGDIVTFRLPRDRSVIYVKRIVGLPGDRVALTHGRLELNGRIVACEPAGTLTLTTSGRQLSGPAYVEHLPEGTSYRIVELAGDTGPLDSTQVFLVPDRHYFVLGDNRDNSNDSSVAAEVGGVGFVPLDHITGKVIFTFGGPPP